MFQQNLDSLSPQVLQYPGNEAEFRSDKNKHRRPNSYLRGPSFGFGGTLDFPRWQILATPRNHFSPPMNQIYLHCLPPQTWICMRGSFDKMQSQILEAEDAIRGTFVLLRGGQSPNPPTLLPIIYLNIISLFFPNTGKKSQKNCSRLSPSLSKEPSIETPSKDDNSYNDGEW